MSTETSPNPTTLLNSIKLFLPNTNDQSLSSTSIPYSSLLGTWHVVASTLPLWKDKKNVKITYTSISGAVETTFDDLVEYNKLSDEKGKISNTIKGIDRLEENGINGVSWKWRGKGLLTPITSRWQLLGFNLSPPSSSSSPPTSTTTTTTEPEWVVTYFASTLFTPSGLDIYSRTSKGLNDEMVKQLVENLKELGKGGEIGRLVDDSLGGKSGMFRVVHDE